MQIDAEGRVLDTGGSSSKLNVVDKELKRMGQQEDDWAKAQPELRVSYRSFVFFFFFFLQEKLKFCTCVSAFKCVNFTH